MTRHRIVLLGSVLGVAVLAALAAPARADVRVSAAIVVTPEDRQLETALAVGLLAAFFDVPVHVVVPLYPKYGFDSTASLLAIHIHSGRPVSHIAGLRSQGHGWGVIAHRLGVHPGAFNQQRVWDKKQDGQVGVLFSDSILARFYGVDVKQVGNYRKQCGSFTHLLLGLNASAKTGHSFPVLFGSRGRENSWELTAKHFGLTTTQLKAAPKPKKAFDKGKGGGKPAQAGGGQGKGKGKGPK